jgi:hypothetical protein
MTEFSTTTMMKRLLPLIPLFLSAFVFQSSAYESTHTGRIASTSIIFYEDSGITYGMVVLKNKKGEYVSIINASAAITMIYYCKEVSSFTNRPDTNAYREEKDITVKPHLFQEITLDDGSTVFGLPLFRYDGVPWFTYDMNWYKLFPEAFYDKERICKKVSLHFNCRGVEAEGAVELLEQEKKLRKRIK